jgi:hypothetical protein
VKRSSIFVFFAFLAHFTFAQSAEEVQQRIREAVAEYWGDYLPNQVINSRYSYYEIDPLYIRGRMYNSRGSVPRSLAPGTFESVHFSLREDAAALRRTTSNQALQLTTTAPCPEKLFDDQLPSNAIRVRQR